jgi:cytochrome P450|tara:strand:+ start:2059 stop:3423 length:1365 start_codon:yes stop_codon:yes gene_type:complete
MSEKNKDINLAKCPRSLDEVDLFAPGAQEYWYESYNFLHEESPVHRIPGEGTSKDTDGFILTKYDDIALVVSNILRFPPPVIEKGGNDDVVSGIDGFPSEKTNELVSTRPFDRDPELMNAMQTSIMSLRPNEELWKAHKRQLTDPWVGPGAHRHTEMITNATNGLIDKWIDKGSVEFISEFTRPLPQIVLANVLGFPIEDIPKHKKWGDAMVMPFVYGQGHRNLLTAEQAGEQKQLLAEFSEYVRDQVADKRENPKEDMITFLTDVVYEPFDRKLTDIEIIGVAYAMTIGGLETTQYALSEQTQILANNHSLYKELQDDREKIRAFIEEALRVRAPTQGLSTRMTTQDETFQGVKMPKGSILHLRYGAANIDADVFECPHEIDMNRKALGRHLTFSQGHRTCPGNGISRLEQLIAWNCLMDRIDKIEYTPETEIKHQPGIMLGTLELKLNFKVN